MLPLQKTSIIPIKYFLNLEGNLSLINAPGGPLAGPCFDLVVIVCGSKNTFFASRNDEILFAF